MQHTCDAIFQESKWLICETPSYFFLYKDEEEFEPEQTGINKRGMEGTWPLSNDQDIVTFWVLW